MSVTKQLTGIQLKSPPAAKEIIEEPVSVAIISNGVFNSKTVAQFPTEFARDVVDRMSGGESLSPDDKQAYFKEYMNIVYGRFISKINNEIGQASRFIIPVVVIGSYKETAETGYENRVETSFMSDQGRIRFTISYSLGSGSEDGRRGKDI